MYEAKLPGSIYLKKHRYTFINSIVMYPKLFRVFLKKKNVLYLVITNNLHVIDLYLHEPHLSLK